MYNIGACPICSHKNEKVYSRSNGFTTLICPNCSHIHVAVDSHIDYRELYNRQFYESYGGVGYFKDFKNQYREHAHKISIIKSLLPEGGRVLEIGCGPGLFLDLMIKHNIDCVGVELNKEAIHYGRSVGCKVPIITSDIKKTTSIIANEKYDLAIMFATIEHVESPMNFIKLITGFLKKNGYLLIDTGIRSKVGDFLENGTSEWLEPPYHLHVFSDKSMRVLLKNSGLSTLWSNTKYNYNLRKEKNITLALKSLLKKIFFAMGITKKNKNTYKGLYICQKLA